MGGAIGDALGSPYEGRRAPVKIDEEGEWRLSDDTQLTLATCEAVAEAGGLVDPELIAARFAYWHRRRLVTGMGASTHKALTELSAGAHWALAGAKGERAAGNGAAMRIAPIAFLLDPFDETGRRTIRDVCRITHHHEEAYAGALAVAAAVRAAASGAWESGSDLLEHVLGVLPDSVVRDRIGELSKIGADLPAEEIADRYGASGYVAESVPLALYGAQQVDHLGFAGMLRELIRAGGDTDTVASIAGQVSGAYLGRGGLPEEMLARLPEKHSVETIARQFAARVERPGR